MPGELDLDELAARATAAAQSWVPGVVIEVVTGSPGGGPVMGSPPSSPGTLDE